MAVNTCGSGFISHAVAVSTTFRFRSFSRYRSSGCPETKNPRTSFSFCSRVCSSQSGAGGNASTSPPGSRRIARVKDSGEQPALSRSRILLRLLRPFHRRPCPAPQTLCPRGPNPSIAPALISDSRTRLFSNRRSTLSQNSHKLANPDFPSALQRAFRASRMTQSRYAQHS